MFWFVVCSAVCTFLSDRGAREVIFASTLLLI